MLRLMFERHHNVLSDRARCYLTGLTTGLVLSDAIGIKDSDDLKDSFELFHPDGGIREAIPFGRGETAPEIDALCEEELIDETWHRIWIGIRNDLFYFSRRAIRMPERSTLSWLGYLRGELEGNGISIEEYDRLKRCCR